MGKQPEGKTKRGRPSLDQRVKEIIFLAATKDREADRKDVAAEIRRSLQESRLKQPAFSTLMNEISEARRTPKSPLEEPWCVGLLPKYPMQPEALPALLEVWKVSLTKREPLTIREAQWVSRLYSFVKGRHQLRNWAKYYANRELAAEATQVPLDTSAADTALAMDLWESATAFVTGIAALPGFVDIPGPVERSSEDDKASFQDALDVLQTETGKWIMRAIQVDDRQLNLSDAQAKMFDEMFDEMTQRYEKGLDGSVQAAWVLFYWLVHLRRGPKWEKLPAERIKWMMEELCAWGSNIVKRDWEHTGQFDFGNVGLFDLSDLPTDPVMRPGKLLKAVGYKLEPKLPAMSKRVIFLEGRGNMVVSDEEAAAYREKYKLGEYDERDHDAIIQLHSQKEEAK